MRDVEKLGSVALPTNVETGVMMMPFVIGAPLPRFLSQWDDAVQAMVNMVPERGVGYLTIDAKVVDAGRCHRRPGLHVDGSGIWGGSRPAPWGSGGFLLAASVHGCTAYELDAPVMPGDEGCCEHMRRHIVGSMPLEAGEVYRLAPLAVHESVPMRRTGWRTVVRISLPNDEPWFDGYTENPDGVMPTGPVLPSRDAFMAYREAG